MSSRVFVPHKSRAQSCAEIFLIESPLLVVLMLRATFLWIATWGKSNEFPLVHARVESYTDRVLARRSPLMNALALLSVATWEMAQVTGLAIIAAVIVMLKICSVPVLVLGGVSRLRSKCMRSNHGHGANASDHGEHHDPHAHHHSHGHGYHGHGPDWEYWRHLGMMLVVIMFILWVLYLVNGIFTSVLHIPEDTVVRLIFGAIPHILKVGGVLLLLWAIFTWITAPIGALIGGGSSGGGGKKAGGGGHGGHGHGGGHH